MIHPTDVNAGLIVLNAVIAVVFIIARWRQRDRLGTRLAAALVVTALWTLLITQALALATPWSPDGAVIVTACGLFSSVVLIRGNQAAAIAASILCIVGIASILHAHSLFGRADCEPVLWGDRQVVRRQQLVIELQRSFGSQNLLHSNPDQAAGWLEAFLPTEDIANEIKVLSRQKVGTKRWHTWLTNFREADPKLCYGVWVEARPLADGGTTLSLRTRPRADVEAKSPGPP